MLNMWKCLPIALLCLTKFSLGQNNIKDSALQPSRSNENGIAYVGEYITGACNSDSLQRLPIQMQAIRCKPRPSLVSVASSNPSVIMHPQAVMVNRCDGHCMHQRSCIATKMRRVNSTAIWYDPQTKQQMCGEIEVEEHLMCGCQCTVKPQHCNMKQEYKSRLCMCECTNETEMKECLKLKRHWNKKTCRCECQQVQQCSTGFEWVPTLCGCGRVMQMEKESSNDVIDNVEDSSEEYID